MSGLAFIEEGYGPNPEMDPKNLRAARSQMTESGLRDRELEVYWRQKKEKLALETVATREEDDQVRGEEIVLISQDVIPRQYGKVKDPKSTTIPFWTRNLNGRIGQGRLAWSDEAGEEVAKSGERGGEEGGEKAKRPNSSAQKLETEEFPGASETISLPVAAKYIDTEQEAPGWTQGEPYHYGSPERIQYLRARSHMAMYKPESSHRQPPGLDTQFRQCPPGAGTLATATGFPGVAYLRVPRRRGA